MREAGLDARTAPGESTVGGGSLPGATCLDLVAIAHPLLTSLPPRVCRAKPPVVARVAGDLLLLDPRTVLPGEAGPLLDAVRYCFDTAFP